MNFSLWPNRKRTTPHHRHRPITIRIPPRPTQPINQIPLRTLILLPKHPILIKTILITSINNKIFKITILTTISRIEKSNIIYFVIAAITVFAWSFAWTSMNITKRHLNAFTAEYVVTQSETTKTLTSANAATKIKLLRK